MSLFSISVPLGNNALTWGGISDNEFSGINQPVRVYDDSFRILALEPETWLKKLGKLS